MNKAVIVIPIYKKEMTNNELASLKQCFKILSKYSFAIVCPENLDISEYTNAANESNIFVDIKRYDNKFFLNINAYCKLMLNLDFYKSFNNFEYMLIYQLDAWVFKDELDYWCNKGYDYIGAPWFESFEAASENSKILKYAGNGGLSLRRISSFIEVLSKFNKNKSRYLRAQSMYDIYYENNLPISKLYKIFKIYFSKKNLLSYYFDNLYEDIVIINCFKKIKKDFRIADYKAGLRFSFEACPEKLFKMNNSKLPFGCHGFLKYNYSFWKKFIDLETDLQKSIINE